MQTINRKSMLYRSKVDYAEWAMTHVLGCAHGCKYPCYAFKNNRQWGRVSSYEEWCQPKLVANTLELLRREIPKYRDKIGDETVHLSFMTDPFMMGRPEVHQMSADAIRLLNENEVKCRILTKGDLLPIACESQYADLLGRGNEWGISLVSLAPEFQHNWEPGTFYPRGRLTGLDALHRAGEYTWGSVEPYPTPNIWHQDVRDLIREVVFVDKIVFGRWNYNGLTAGYDHWYAGQAEIVRSSCRDLGIECVIKSEIPVHAGL